MQLILHCIGRMKSGPETTLIDRYIERVEKSGPQIGLTMARITQIPESRAGDAPSRKREESANCLALVEKHSAKLVVLDETGKSMTSRDFAAMIGNMRDNGAQNCVFAIGGADGHDEALLQRADFTLSLGKLTWPHQLARILLAEQLYRATAILSGHPYHRD